MELKTEVEGKNPKGHLCGLYALNYYTPGQGYQPSVIYPGVLTNGDIATITAKHSTGNGVELETDNVKPFDIITREAHRLQVGDKIKINIVKSFHQGTYPVSTGWIFSMGWEKFHV